MPTVNFSGSNLDSIGRSVAAHRHPAHTLFEEEWTQLADVREGTGGFMTGEYLVAHPREWKDHDAASPSTPTKKLLARRNLARYENLAAAVLEAKKAALFRAPASRMVGSTDEGPITEWWENVDGLGTHITVAMQAWWDLAATFGHLVLYFEAPDATLAETAADVGLPVIRTYSPLDVLDWLEDDNGELQAIKVVEAIPAESFSELKTKRQTRIRIIDREGWILTNDRGKVEDRGEHGLGRLPVTYLYGKRRSLINHIGQSVLGTPGNYIDLYNLISEVRELIRNQTFSMINLPLGTGPDAIGVENAQSMLGQQTGTMNVLFSALPASILSGDAANVETIQREIAAVKRDIYRVTGVPWESDSRDAESGDSMRLRREELNTRLQGYGDECEKAETDLADLFYRWQEGPERGPEMAVEDVTIRYPEQFDPTPFEGLLQQIEAAQAINMPPTFMKQLRKAIVGKFEGMGSLPPDIDQAITQEIESAEERDPEAEMAQRLELQRVAMEGRDAVRDEENEENNETPEA